jgi:rsbT co-antagonist protein RsbR
MDDFSKYMDILNIDQDELTSRLRFFEITENDKKNLIELQEFARSKTEEITEALYQLILSHPDTRSFFPDEETVARVKKMQNKYFLELFNGKYELNYVENRLRVGAVHEIIGMPVKWYMGAYRSYLRLIHKEMSEYYCHDQQKIIPKLESVSKMIFFDMALAIDSYMASHVETMTRHQAAIRELSTPAISIHSGILLLPIIGTVDTQRAKQIMETALTMVVSKQAKILIIDIAGVAVVDTKVADHLIQTTASVKLLGATTILTGITASVAKTVVQLGVDISSMITLSSLAEGISAALELSGKTIVSKDAANEILNHRKANYAEHHPHS